jgi:hypothetical protein
MKSEDSELIEQIKNIINGKEKNSK